MTYGFEIRNSSNKLIANSTDFNYGLIAEGTIDATTEAFASSPSWSTIGDTTEIPLVFLKFDNVNSATQPAYFIAIRKITTSVIEVGFFSLPYPSAGRPTLTTGSVYYRAYKTFKGLPTKSGQTYGLQIFDANNSKTFDSGYEIPKVTGIVTLPKIEALSNIANPAFPAVLLPTGSPNSLWLSVNAFNATTNIRGYYGLESPTVYFCWPGLTAFGGVIYGGFGTSVGGGASTTVSYDGPKNIMIMPA